MPNENRKVVPIGNANEMPSQVELYNEVLRLSEEVLKLKAQRGMLQKELLRLHRKGCE